MHRIHDFIDSHHSFLCCSPYYPIVRNRVLISKFDLLKIRSFFFQKLKLDTKHLQKQAIFLLTIIRYVVHTVVEINHISDEA